MVCLLPVTWNRSSVRASGLWNPALQRKRNQIISNEQHEQLRLTLAENDSMLEGLAGYLHSADGHGKLPTFFKVICLALRLAPCEALRNPSR